MFGFFSNVATALRFAKYLGLIPLVLKLVETAESTKKTGEEKRAQVIECSERIMREVAKLGFIPEELVGETAKITGELTDAVIRVYNSVGIFRHAAEEAQGPKAKAKK